MGGAVARLANRVYVSMPPSLYRCPNTGYRVQGFVLSPGLST